MIDLAALASPALFELCRRCHVRSLDIFGSAITDRFDPARSDLDFLVEFSEPASGGFYGDYFNLQEGLQALFQRPVDLIEASTLRNPYLRHEVLRTKRRVYPQP